MKYQSMCDACINCDWFKDKLCEGLIRYHYRDCSKWLWHETAKALRNENMNRKGEV